MEESQVQKAEVEIVEPENKQIMVTEKELEKMIARAIVTVEKKDYRATLNLNTNQQQVPDAMTAFIDVDEGKQNDFGFNRSLMLKVQLIHFSFTSLKLPDLPRH